MTSVPVARNVAAHPTDESSTHPPVTGGHVLIASDKFKGSLTAAEVGAAVGAGLRRVVPDLDVVVVPVADGGDGTLAAAYCGRLLVGSRLLRPARPASP